MDDADEPGAPPEEFAAAKQREAAESGGRRGRAATAHVACPCCSWSRHPAPSGGAHPPVGELSHL